MRTDRRYRHRAFAGSLAAAALLLAACGSSSGSQSGSSAGTGGTGQPLTIAQPGILPNLDPINADNVPVDSVAVAMYEPLVDYGADGKLAGRLASKWTFSTSGDEITFTIRDGAKFHDGTPVTAKDVAFTFDRIKKVGVGLARSISLYAGSTVVDDHTVTIKLSKPSSVFVGYLAQVYILNSKLVTEHLGADNGQAWLATNDAGSGPYRLDSYQPNQQVVLKKDANYNATLPDGVAGTVTVRLIPQAQTIANEMLSGGVDVTRGIVGPAIKQVEGNAKFKMTYPTALKMLYVWANTQKGATADPRVRQALRLAYNYAGHIKTIGQGLGSPAAGMLPTAMQCVAKLPAAAQDLTKAKALLQEAGAANLTLTMQYQTFSPEFQAAAVSLQSSLKEIGVTVNLSTVTFPNWLQELKSAQTTPDLAMSWYNPPTPDVGSVLSTVFNGATVGTGQNFGQFKNDEVDALLAKAVPETDDAARCADYQKVQQVLDEQSAAIPLIDESNTTPVVARVGIGGTDADHPGHVGLVPQLLTVG